MLCAKKLFWRALEHHFPALAAAFRAHVDDPIGIFDHIQVVLDDDDRVAGIDQPVHDGQQVADIRHVQAGGRLVHHIDAALFVQFAGELDALAFAARQACSAAGPASDNPAPHRSWLAVCGRLP